MNVPAENRMLALLGMQMLHMPREHRLRQSLCFECFVRVNPGDRRTPKRSHQHGAHDPRPRATRFFSPFACQEGHQIIPSTEVLFLNHFGKKRHRQAWFADYDITQPPQTLKA